MQSFPLLLSTALMAQVVVLSPVVNTAYWQDDDANAYIRGYVRWIGDHFWHFIWTANVTQVKTFGRPMPLGVIQTYGIFYVQHDRIVYKVLLIAVTLVASGMVGLVVRRLGASPAAAAMAAGLPAVIWQLHLPHDPLVSYVGLVQTVTIYAAATILMFLSWLRRGGHWRVAVVIALTVCAYVTYQDAYLLPVLLVPVAWYERRCSWRRAVILAGPGLIVGAAFIILALILEGNLSASSGYQANLDPGVVVTAWAKIITSGLPVIGWLADPGPRSLPAIGDFHSALRGLAVAVLLFPILMAAARPGAADWLRDRRAAVAILAVTAVVMVTPAALTAVAPQYQTQVEWGWGYLPMYFAGVGWAILGALVLGAALGRLARRRWAGLVTAAALAAVGGVLAGINAEGSARVVAYMQPVIRSRDLIEASFQHRVLGDVPTFATVLWDGPEVELPQGPWVGSAINMEAWTREFVNRPITMRLMMPGVSSATVCSDATGGPAPCAVLKTPTFWLRTTDSGAHGFVAVARVGLERWPARADTTTAVSSPGSQPVAFVRDPRISAGGGPLPLAVTMDRVRPGRSPRPATVPSGLLHVLRRGPGWALVRLPPQTPFVASSIGVTFT